MITDSPESSYTSTTTSPVHTTSSLPPSTTSTTASQTLTHSPGGCRSNVGAIAGWIFGGMIGLLLVAILATLLYRRKRGLRRRRDDQAAATTREAGLVGSPDRRRSNQPTFTQQTISSGSGTLPAPQPFVPYDPTQFDSEYEGYVRLCLRLIVYYIIMTMLPQKYSRPNAQSPTSPVSSRRDNQTFFTHQPLEYPWIASGRYTGIPEVD